MLRDFGYEDNHLTKFEIEHFVLLARTHGDLKETVERIVAYREYDEKYELEKFLKQKSTMDSRFYKTLSNIIHLSFSPESVRIHEEHLSEVGSKVEKFNKILESKDLVHYNSESNIQYRDLLYSNKSLLEYHSN
jgi:hypothetical protein